LKPKNQATSMDINNFRSYYDSYYDQLCFYLNFYTDDVSIKEDVLQEVFLRLWENRDTIEIKYIKTYLFHATRNTVLNYLRDEGKRHALLEKWFDQQKYETQGKDCFDIEAFMEKLNKIVDQLPPRCQEIFKLSHDEKLTYKQISEKLDISVKTVEAQMGIALKRIREGVAMTSMMYLLWLL
jgi:RNA polymerase sigma-70 factor (family 1)